MPVLPRFDSANYPELHVMHFGYEKEGLYSEDNDDRDDDGERMNEYFRHDGSVEASQSYSEDASNFVDGEIASPKFRIDRFLQFRNFEKSNPVEWTDQTCGLHIHESTNNALAFQKLCDLEFYTKFRKESWRFMHAGLFCEDTIQQFEDRFNGESQYCLSGFNPDKSINSGMRDFKTIYTTTNGRYNDMNFDSYHKFGTVECRLFPSSSSHDEVINMVEWFVNFTNHYLASVTPYERGNNETIELMVDEIEINEEVLLCV